MLFRSAMSAPARCILVTGGAGYLGGEVVGRLTKSDGVGRVVALDVRTPPIDQRVPGVEYLVGDVRDASLVELLKSRSVESVVHLASIVQPGGPDRRAFERSVDVGGTENVLKACVAAGVQRIVVTSSGAAYEIGRAHV